MKIKIQSNELQNHKLIQSFIYVRQVSNKGTTHLDICEVKFS